MSVPVSAPGSTDGGAGILLMAGTKLTMNADAVPAPMGRAASASMAVSRRPRRHPLWIFSAFRDRVMMISLVRFVARRDSRSGHQGGPEPRPILSPLFLRPLATTAEDDPQMVTRVDEKRWF